MPALNPSERLANGNRSKAAPLSSAKMSSSDASTSNAYLKKKLLMLDEQQESPQNGFSGDHNNNNSEETFADICTVSEAHRATEDDGPPIFGPRSNNLGSINQTAKDQFAVALLRLQADLDATSKRLTELEVKLDRQAKQQASSSRAAANAAAAKGGYFNRANLASIAYLGWPVVVFFAIRALERRSLAARVVSA